MASETVDNAPAISDLPSGDPINPPLPAAAAADAAPDATVSRPNKLPLAALLAAAPSNIDAFVAHLSRCFQTPAGTDTVLLLVCYTSRLSASVLEAVSATALRRSARRLVALAFSLPPDATIILSKAPPPSSAASLALRVATRLRALSALLSEARTIMRLWALLPMYLWLRRLMTTPSVKTEGASEKEKQDSGAAAVDRAISWIQVTACLLLQSLESASYLASRGILPLTAAQTGAAARWSVRFWSVYVGSELGRLAVERLRRRRLVESGELDAASSEYREWEGTWSRTLARQASWFPLTVHWSMEKGFLPDAGVGLLGSIPGVVQMRQLWKDTA